MAFTNPSPLIGSPMYGTLTAQQSVLPNVSPQEWEYIQQVRRTGYDPNQIQQIQNNQQQVQQSDPYNDFETEFLKCSSLVQNRIMQDEEFRNVMAECDKHIQHMVEQIVRPQVMQTKDGRLAFEKLLAIFRERKDAYAKEEADNMEKFQKLMNDEVVRKRMAEMEGKTTTVGGN